MTAHTPGPWNVRQCDGGYRNFDQQDWAIVADNLITPCLVWGGAGFSEGEANAHLIAAAPDLLASLTNVRRLITEAAMTGFNCHEGDWAERLFASQQVSSDAIRKATGTELRPLTPAGIDTGEDK